jgi:cellulose biosynthesis protein BcsQ
MRQPQVRIKVTYEGLQGGSDDNDDDASPITVHDFMFIIPGVLHLYRLGNNDEWAKYELDDDFGFLIVDNPPILVNIAHA